MLEEKFVGKRQKGLTEGGKPGTKSMERKYLKTGNWKSSTTTTIYKGKGDAMECSKYRGLRLLEHGMKVYEYVLEKRIQDMVAIVTISLGFVKVGQLQGQC